MRYLAQVTAYKHLILILAFRQIGKLFDRTALGILWMPISFVLHVLSIGLVFRYLFGEQDPDYLLFFGVSFAIWRAFTAAVSEGAVLWPSFSSYVRETNVPIVVYPIVWMIKIFVVLFIYIISAQVFFLLWEGFIFKSIVLAIPGVLLSMIVVLQFGLIWSFVCLRFRDLASITPNLVLIAYLVTPVFWRAELLGERQFIATLNPLFHLLEVVRSPILVGEIPIVSLQVSLGLFVFLLVLNLLIWRFVEKRLAVWL